MDPAVTFLSVIGASMVIRILGGWAVSQRVMYSIRNRGGRVVEMSWQPHGKGRLEKKFSRLYRIVYQDVQGQTHLALISSSPFAGIQTVKDEVTAQAPDSEPAAPPPQNGHP